VCSLHTGMSRFAFGDDGPPTQPTRAGIKFDFGSRCRKAVNVAPSGQPSGSKKARHPDPAGNTGGGAAGKQPVTAQGIVGAEDLVRAIAMQVATLQQQQQQHQPPPPQQRQQPPSQPAGEQANKRKTPEPSARRQEKADEAPKEGTKVQCKAMCRGGFRCE
jgi:hypothetical protein